VLPGKEDCYVYKRPGSNTWQYFLAIPGEGEERKSTRVKGDPDDHTVGLEDAKEVALDRKLTVMGRQKAGLKTPKSKRLFDFIDDYLNEEEKRVSNYNRKGFITAETFRLKKHHLNMLKKFYRDKNIKIENIDFAKLHNYPLWRLNPSEDNPSPPKTNHTVITELTTIRAYFKYLEVKGYLLKEPTFHRLARESLRNNRRDFLNPREYKQTINTVRAWANSQACTPSQEYNRKVLYNAILIMANSCLRVGEVRSLKWSDLDENGNLSKEEQKVGHLIKIRKEATKTGEPRTVQTPTKKYFEEIRKLSGIPKQPKSRFPHVPDEYKDLPVFAKFNHLDKPLGIGTWNRCWQEIKKLCSDRYWNNKNITWYFARHTGISFAVMRGVPLLLLARNAGTGLRYVEDVYYHHQSESQETWTSLNQNRTFHERVNTHRDEPFIQIEEVMDDIEV
jgi:integrase